MSAHASPTRNRFDRARQEFGRELLFQFGLERLSPKALGCPFGLKLQIVGRVRHVGAIVPSRSVTLTPAVSLLSCRAARRTTNGSVSQQSVRVRTAPRRARVSVAGRRPSQVRLRRASPLAGSKKVAKLRDLEIAGRAFGLDDRTCFVGLGICDGGPLRDEPPRQILSRRTALRSLMVSLSRSSRRLEARFDAFDDRTSKRIRHRHLVSGCRGRGSDRPPIGQIEVEPWPDQKRSPVLLRTSPFCRDPAHLRPFSTIRRR